ncbi:MAG: DUF302 domain-containing protein [Chlorobi bacterium]|nr:DUF302 domain-containing protein [Chlorobiota bacterium]
MSYYINKIKQGGFQETIAEVKEALSKEGFGVLSEISIDEKLKEKLGVDFRKYIILGACNPAYAFKALQHEDKIGTMLPCNVIVQQLDEKNVEVAAIDPVASMMAVENEAVAGVAGDIKAKLGRVINSL